jgi:steroid 5-alpha reductase family enzyme
MGWIFLLIFFVVSLALCAVGFKKYVWFMSIGYGFAVAGIGVALAVLLLAGSFEGTGFDNIGKLAALLVFPVLFVVYGLRLSLFLAIREFKNAAYKKTLDEVTKTDKMPLPVMIVIWICCAALYVAQTTPAFYRPYNGDGFSVCLCIGIVLAVLGIVLESAADKQKSAQKAKNPHMVATEGLYKIVRCPNYFGEILFWTGVFVSGLDTLKGVGQWIIAVFGYICIVLVMFNGAQRLEKRQNKSYGDKPEYQAYVAKTPIIIPLVPLYHLNKK